MKKYSINNDDKPLVNEAAVQYLRSFKSPMDKVKFIRNGVSFNVFEQLREEVPFSDEEWAVLLDISLNFSFWTFAKQFSAYVENKSFHSTTKTILLTKLSGIIPSFDEIKEVFDFLRAHYFKDHTFER